MSNKNNKNDKHKYNEAYKKEHYKRPTIYFNTNDYENINSYCNDMNLSFSEYVKMCCKYCLDNVHIDELKQYKK